MRQDQSTDQQLAELEEYCKRYNLVHRHKFVDEARSGGSTAGRDDFNRMIDLYEAQPGQRPQGLLLWNYARFARDIDDSQLNKIRIRRWGIFIHSLNDAIPEGEHGRIIEFLIDVANEEKRKQTSADARRGLKELVQKYRCVPGIPPRGFLREPVEIGMRRDRTAHIAHRWVPNPEWTSRIRQAFAMRAGGHTLKQIQDQLRIFGSLNSYKTFFSNQLYIGILQFGDLTIDDYCEPIVDRPTWDAVQRIIEKHAQHRDVKQSELHPRRQSGIYLLSGLVYCARCSSPLWGMTSGQRSGKFYYRYACTRAKRRRDCDFSPIPARQLEKHVIDALHKFVEDPDNLAELLEADRQAQADQFARANTKTREVQAQLRGIRKSITNITAAIGESGHSKALLASLQDLEAQETQLQARLLQLKSETPKVDPPLTREEILQHSRSLARVLETKDPAEVRMGLLAMTRRIVVDRRGDQVFGVITYKKRRSREPESDEESADIITAFIAQCPVGAPTHRRSNIPFSFMVKSNKRSR